MEPTNLTTEYRNPKDLRPHPDNPRGEMDPASEAITSLAADVAKRNLIQPIVISSTGVVLAGHRRRVAAIVAGLDSVPVIIRDLQSGELVEELFLAENMQRQDLSPLEEARAIAAVQKKLEKKTRKPVTRMDLARRLQIGSQTIALRLAILDLPERVQRFFHLLDLPVNSSTQLARLSKWPEEVKKVADRLVTRQLTLRSLPAVIDRRIKDLNQLSDSEAILAREPRMRNIQRHHPENLHTPALTRAIVVENLAKKGQGSVSLFNLSKVLDSTCCNCGMMGTPAVCLNCPLPKFVNGLIGRADANGKGNAGFENEED